MIEVYLLFVDPGHKLVSLHHTIDGATHAAIAEGAAAMADGSAISLSAVRTALRDDPSVHFACGSRSGNQTAVVERHAVFV